MLKKTQRWRASMAIIFERRKGRLSSLFLSLRLTKKNNKHKRHTPETSVVVSVVGVAAAAVAFDDDVIVSILVTAATSGLVARDLIVLARCRFKGRQKKKKRQKARARVCSKEQESQKKCAQVFN